MPGLRPPNELGNAEKTNDGILRGDPRVFRHKRIVGGGVMACRWKAIDGALSTVDGRRQKNLRKIR